jgi:aryl-alcohol dehydrogenase-like predicted oxidoreductase
MQYNQLGTSELNVSRMALGAMTFGNYSFGSFRARVDPAAADKMVGLAIDAGVNLFDTAEGYGNGQSEEILGAAIRRAGSRDRVMISTKIITYQASPDEEDLPRRSYQHVVDKAESALRRLGSDHIDLFQIYQPDFTTPLDEDALRALDDLTSRGLVRYTGWTNQPAWYAARAEAVQRQRGYAPFVSAQIHYSLVGRDVEHDILPYCRAAGVGTLIWSPLAGGFLSGKYTREDPTGGGGRRAAFTTPPIDLERGFLTIEAMQDIARRHNLSVSHVAYAWLLAKPEVSSIIVGASHPEQLADNLAVVSHSLTDTEIASLDAMAPPEPIYPEARWWGA